MGKNRWGLAVACVGLIIVSWFRARVYYMYKIDNINEKITDLKLITVNDYTIKAPIDAQFFAWWVGEHNFDQSDVPIRKFEQDLRKNIEKCLLEKSAGTLSKKCVEIADISFSFNNSGLIKRLQKRAN